ncbi:MAG: hypothetical protein ABID83_06035, partial [Candidatus Omnitrophota bacterium]
IKNKEIHLIVNTPVGRGSKYDDSYIRIMAVQQKIPYITSMAAAEASIEGIQAIREKKVLPKALQDYYEDLAQFDEKYSAETNKNVDETVVR